jgi:glycine betaine catabolism B
MRKLPIGDMDYEAALSGRRDWGGGAWTFRLEKPQDFSYNAGQYAVITLAPGLAHAFTLSSAPREPHLEFTTRISESAYKKALSALSIGSKVGVRGPLGSFTWRGGKAVFLAGGIGVTPFRSILNSMPAADAVLVWGVNTVGDAFFKADFDALGAKVEYVPAKPPQGWAGISGFITAGHIRRLVPDLAERLFYVCGPPAMVDAMGRVLEELKVPGERVVVERFGGY